MDARLTKVLLDTLGYVVLPSNELAIKAENFKAFVQAVDSLIADIAAQHAAVVKDEAHEAYWDASDSNRADRWNDNFDASVREQFEKYWASKTKGG